jgi:hypothetical protein
MRKHNIINEADILSEFKITYMIQNKMTLRIYIPDHDNDSAKVEDLIIKQNFVEHWK